MRQKNKSGFKKNNNLKSNRSKNEPKINQNKLYIEKIFDEAMKKFERVQKMGFELKLFAFDALNEEATILFQNADYLKSAGKSIEALSIFKRKIIEDNNKSFEEEEEEKEEKEEKDEQKTNFITDYNEQIIHDNILKCYLNISICYLELNEFENAWHISNECVRIYPENSTVLYRRAIAMSKIYPSDEKEIQLAILDIQQALKLSPENEEFLLKFRELEDLYNNIQNYEKSNIIKSREPKNPGNLDESKHLSISKKNVKKGVQKLQKSQKSQNRIKNSKEGAKEKSKLEKLEKLEESENDNDSEDEEDEEQYAITQNEYRCVPELERLQEIIEKGKEAMKILREKKDFQKLTECEMNIEKLEGIRDYLLFIINSDIMEPTPEIKKKIFSLGIDWDNPISRETIRSIRSRLIKDVRKLTANELDIAAKNSKVMLGKGVEIPEDVKIKLSLGKRVKKMVNLDENKNENENENPTKNHLRKLKKLGKVKNQSIFTTFTNGANSSSSLNQFEDLFKIKVSKYYIEEGAKKHELILFIGFLLAILAYFVYILLKSK